MAYAAARLPDRAGKSACPGSEKAEDSEHQFPGLGRQQAVWEQEESPELAERQARAERAAFAVRPAPAAVWPGLTDLVSPAQPEVAQVPSAPQQPAEPQQPVQAAASFGLA